MSLILSGLTSNSLLVTLGYGGFFDGASNYLSVDLEMEDVVTPSDKYKATTGLFSNSGSVGGWIYDKRRLEDWDLLRTRYNTFVGGHTAGLKEGTVLTDWISGVVSGMKYHDIAHYRLSGDAVSWTPRIKTGAYSIFFDERNLFSDYCVVGRVDNTDNVDGMNSFMPESEVVYQTIEAAIWKRDDAFRRMKFKSFDYVDTFTGEIDTLTDTRLETEDVGGFIPENISTRVNEFTVRESIVYFNTDHTLSVGTTEPPVAIPGTLAEALRDFWENKGVGAGDGRLVFTNYFPLQSGSVRLATVDVSDNVTEWTEVSSLNFSEPTDQHFTVDYDLGILEIGGFQAPDLFLKTSIDNNDDEIVVYLDEETMSQYPEQGVLVIGTEEIRYYRKGRSSFYQLTRGYNSTTAAAHVAGDIVSDRKHGLGTSDTILISYDAIPRVEYEVTPYTIRSCNRNSWLDTQPLRNASTTNVLQVDPTEFNLSQVILETASPLIGGNLYGPVNYGTDVSRLTARGLDALGNPVDGIQLSIEILSGPGSLNGSLSEYTAFTNSIGETYAVYNAPYDPEDVEIFATGTEHDAGDTIMTLPLLSSSVQASDIWVFQILKHDPTFGIVGARIPNVSYADAGTYGDHFYNDGRLRVDAALAEKYKGGKITITGSSNIRYIRTIVHLEPVEDVGNPPQTFVYLDSSIPATTADATYVYVAAKDSVAWNPTLLNGVKVILYEWTTDAEHPITGDPGAYAPLQPTSVSGNQITFDSRLLPLPDPTDDTSNVGGYMAIAPQVVSLQAYGRDPITNRIIRSNIIKLEVTLPAFLTGVDKSGVLPVPKGFTLISDESNVGAGLGGGNFITLNPKAEGINRFGLTGAFP